MILFVLKNVKLNLMILFMIFSKNQRNNTLNVYKTLIILNAVNAFIYPL